MFHNSTLDRGYVCPASMWFSHSTSPAFVSLVGVFSLSVYSLYLPPLSLTLSVAAAPSLPPLRSSSSLPSLHLPFTSSSLEMQMRWNLVSSLGFFFSYLTPLKHSNSHNSTASPIPLHPPLSLSHLMRRQKRKIRCRLARSEAPFADTCSLSGSFWPTSPVPLRCRNLKRCRLWSTVCLFLKKTEQSIYVLFIYLFFLICSHHHSLWRCDILRCYPPPLELSVLQLEASPHLPKK